MNNKQPLSEQEIATLVQHEVTRSIDFDRTELRAERLKAIEYFNGVMKDLASEEGRSSQTTRDIADHIGYIIPGLMRVFFAGDQIVTYNPVGPEDEEAAKQATEYINYLIVNESDGYQVFQDVFHDALLHGNGVVKSWWETEDKVTSTSHTNLSEDQLTILLNDPDVEVIEHEAVPTIDVETGAEVVVHNVRIKRTVNNGRLKICAVPPEQFLIDLKASTLDDARFVAQRSALTRSELIERGYDAEVVSRLPAFSGSYDQIDFARREQYGSIYTNNGVDDSTDEVLIIEAYIKCDYNGDGIAETLKVVMGENSTELLDWEQWDNEFPFADVCAYRIPHRYIGKSIFDDLEDVQRVKTVQLRQMLDNLYEANIPDRVVNDDAVINKDALYDRQIGNVIRVNGDPNAAVATAVVPMVAQNALAGLNYMDEVASRRTGISKDSMALDQQALKNQTATAVNAAQSAQYSKIELIARNFAEMGFKRFFKQVLKIVIQHQDKPKTIRLRNKWVEFDPRPWNASMDCEVSVGLGSGSKDRDVALLHNILNEQKQVLQVAGPNNPIVSLAQIANTYRKIVETTGIKNVDQFFSEVTPEAMQAMANQPQKPDPEMQKAQMQMQIEQMKAQSDLQLEQAKTQGEQALQKMKMEMEVQIQRERNMMELQLIREKNALEIQHKRELAAINAQLKREEMAQELALTEQSNMLDALTKPDTLPDTNIQNRTVTDDIK